MEGYICISLWVFIVIFSSITLFDFFCLFVSQFSEERVVSSVSEENLGRVGVEKTMVGIYRMKNFFQLKKQGRKKINGHLELEAGGRQGRALMGRWVSLGKR